MADNKTKLIVKAALKEDIGRKDITTSLTVPSSLTGDAFIVSKEKGVLCGIDVAREAFYQIDKGLKFRALRNDGACFKKGAKIAVVGGKLCSILIAERVALNFLSLLSGISTATRRIVSKIGKCPAKIMDTRKTLPNLRFLAKYAVKTGGGYNHRMSLDDGIIVKDNHLRAAKCIHHGRLDEVKIRNLLETMRKKTCLKLEVEVENFKEFKGVIKYRPDIIMLDNFPFKQLKKAVKYRNDYFPRVKLEVSGGVNLKTVSKIACSGIDLISIGSLTHSSKAIDFSLEIRDK